MPNVLPCTKRVEEQINERDIAYKEHRSRANAAYARHVRGSDGEITCWPIGFLKHCTLFMSRNAAKLQSVSANDDSTLKSTSLSTSVFGSRIAHRQTKGDKIEMATASMIQRMNVLQERIATGKASAVDSMKNGHKQSALRQLKKTKILEKQLVMVGAAIDGLEMQSDIIQQANLQKEVNTAIGSSSFSLKNHDKLVEQTEDAIGHSQDIKDSAQELSNVMTGFNPMGGDFDDDELLEELGDMISIDVDSTLSGEMELDRAKLEAKHALLDKGYKKKKIGSESEEWANEHLSVSVAQ